MGDNERIPIRCVLVGASAVGKSTLVEKMTNGSVSGDYSMTSRVAVHRKSYVPGLNSRLKLEMSFLDCPGKEIYEGHVKDICKRLGPKCIIVAVFDVTNRASMAPVESLLTWLGKQNVKSTELCGILLANKIDLIDKRIVSPSEGQQKAKMLKLRYFECSALNDADQATQEFEQLLGDMVQTSLVPANDADRSGPSQPAVAMKSLESN